MLFSRRKKWFCVEMADGPDFFVKCRYMTEAIAAAQAHGKLKLYTLPEHRSPAAATS